MFLCYFYSLLSTNSKDVQFFFADILIFWNSPFLLIGCYFSIICIFLHYIQFGGTFHHWCYIEPKISTVFSLNRAWLLCNRFVIYKIILWNEWTYFLVFLSTIVEFRGPRSCNFADHDRGWSVAWLCLPDCIGDPRFNIVKAYR